MNIKEILEKSIEVLHSLDWIQGETYTQVNNKITGVCAIGAVYVACGRTLSSGVNGNTSPIATCRALSHWLLTEKFISGIETFNDDPFTTKEDVISMFKEVLYSLDNESNTH